MKLHIQGISKVCRENSSFVKTGQGKCVLCIKAFSHLWYLSEFILEWELFQIRFVEEIKTHILGSVTFSENRAIYETISKNMVEPERPQIGIWRRVLCWISKPRTHAHTHTHKCVILIAFPWQQWFRERTSMLYVHCLSWLYSVYDRVLLKDWEGSAFVGV
jgi:hypothetical protein